MDQFRIEMKEPLARQGSAAFVVARCIPQEGCK